MIGLFGIARGYVSGIFAQFGVYIIVAAVTACLVYHFIAVHNAYSNGVSAERQANLVMSEKAKAKIIAEFQARERMITAQLNKQREEADKIASDEQRKSAELDRLVKAMLGAQETAWPKEVVKEIYK